MSRLYLIIFLCFSCSAIGQNDLKNYLRFAKEQHDKGDYYYALQYYQKALEIDSATVDILWNYAETLRAYKDYRRAEYYYQKVYDKEDAVIYPPSLLQLGLMQKQNGKYDQAINTFKQAKKKYAKKKNGYLYLKSKRELISTVWAKGASVDSADVSIESLPETVNSPNSEFGHGIIDGQLIFSSLRADSISASEEVYSKEYTTQLYQSKKTENNFDQSSRINDLIIREMNSGNGTLSLDGKRFYFSQCSEDGYNYRCKIMVANYSNGKWKSIDSLGSIINQAGTNTTMPCIANLGGDEALIFTSDRSGGKGGLDIYYSKIKNGQQYSKVRSIKTLNSLDNEVTPWWDDSNQRLYFSSSWHNGFGGQDIFYSDFNKGKFEKPVNVGLPFNSSANDIYYFKDEDSSYVTSNRIGVLYSKNPTCCSDIFSIKPPKQIVPPTKEETLADLNKRLPVTLYFHNDIPNPRSRSTTTDVNYIDSYNDYTAMIDQYKKEYSKGLSGEKINDAKEDIESFFIEYVDKGVSDLQLFQTLLLQELDRGARINVTVKGFASPLAKTDYNVNLTKRRIASLVNYLNQYNDGVFSKYISGTASNGGKVIFSEIPFGEYTANQLTSDNPNDVKNSVYSRSAAIERKIEIQSVSYLEEQEEFSITSQQPVYDAGTVKKGTPIIASFVITNSSSETIELDNIRKSDESISVSIDQLTLQPSESTSIKMTVNTSDLSGFTVSSIFVKQKNDSQELKLYVSSEIQD